MTPLGDAIFLALHEQDWRITYDVASTEMVLLSPDGAHVFELDTVIFSVEELEPFLRATLMLLRVEAGFVWPWPPLDPSGAVKGGETPRWSDD